MPEQTQGPAHSWRWTPSTAERPRLASAQSIHSKHPRHRTSSSEHPRTAAAPPSPHATTTAKHIRKPRELHQPQPETQTNTRATAPDSTWRKPRTVRLRASQRKTPGSTEARKHEPPQRHLRETRTCTRTPPPAGGQKSSANGHSREGRHWRVPSKYMVRREGTTRAFRPDAMPPAARRGPMHTTRALEHGTRPRANDLVRTQRRPRSCGAWAVPLRWMAALGY